MDAFAKPENVDTDVIKNLGPFAPLIGTWEGEKGVDVSPERNGSEETKFRERLSFEPLGPVINGPQVLYGMSYKAVAWPIGEEKAFHQEVGYWLWDPKDKQVMRCFMVPRGVVLIAGGTAEPEAKSFNMEANAGSETYGILSNPFINTSKRTIKYTLSVTIENNDHFSYEEDTVLQIHGVKEPFHHTDGNRLQRV